MQRLLMRSNCLSQRRAGHGESQAGPPTACCGLSGEAGCLGTSIRARTSRNERLALPLSLPHDLSGVVRNADITALLVSAVRPRPRERSMPDSAWWRRWVYGVPARDSGRLLQKASTALPRFWRQLCRRRAQKRGRLLQRLQTRVERQMNSARYERQRPQPLVQWILRH
jgi:hypothetical protein